MKSSNSSPVSQEEQKIAQLKKRVDEAKAARAAAAARKEMAEKRLAEIEAQVRAMGVEPEEIENEIARLEREILDEINRLGIGPQGLGGRVTALAVHIETAPTHIGALPVAVNIQCHAARHKEVVL